MPDALDDAAEDVRTRLGIPGVGSAESHSSVLDGWRVTGAGVRNIGLVRVYDVDLLPGTDHVQMEPRLLARELMDHMHSEAISTHVSRSFAQMDAAHRHIEDPSIVLAIASREASPRAAITTSDTFRCSYHRGGRTMRTGAGSGCPSRPRCGDVSARRRTCRTRRIRVTTSRMRTSPATRSSPPTYVAATS